MKVIVTKSYDVMKDELFILFVGVTDAGHKTTQKVTLHLGAGRPFYDVKEIVELLEKTIRELKEIKA